MLERVVNGVDTVAMPVLTPRTASASSPADAALSSFRSLRARGVDDVVAAAATSSFSVQRQATTAQQSAHQMLRQSIAALGQALAGNIEDAADSPKATSAPVKTSSKDRAPAPTAAPGPPCTSAVGPTPETAPQPESKTDGLKAYWRTTEEAIAAALNEDPVPSDSGDVEVEIDQSGPPALRHVVKGLGPTAAAVAGVLKGEVA